MHVSDASLKVGRVHVHFTLHIHKGPFAKPHVLTEAHTEVEKVYVNIKNQEHVMWTKPSEPFAAPKVLDFACIWSGPREVVVEASSGELPRVFLWTRQCKHFSPSDSLRTCGRGSNSFLEK